MQFPAAWVKSFVARVILGRKIVEERRRQDQEYEAEIADLRRKAVEVRRRAQEAKSMHPVG